MSHIFPSMIQPSVERGLLLFRFLLVSSYVVVLVQCVGAFVCFALMILYVTRFRSVHSTLYFLSGLTSTPLFSFPLSYNKFLHLTTIVSLFLFLFFGFLGAISYLTLPDNVSRSSLSNVQLFLYLLFSTHDDYDDDIPSDSVSYLKCAISHLHFLISPSSHLSPLSSLSLVSPKLSHISTWKPSCNNNPTFVCELCVHLCVRACLV